MKNRFLTAVGAVLFVSSAIGAQAQPVINSSYILGHIGTTVTEETYYPTPGQDAAVQALRGISGANKTWDFSALTYLPGGDISTDEFIAMPAVLIGSDNPAFSSATFAIRNPVGTEIQDGIPFDVSYYFLTDSQFSWLGSYEFDGVETLSIVYDAPFLLFPSPLQFGSTWVGHGDYTEDGVAVATTRTGDVTGWGTLITPAGSVPVLRVESVTSISFDGFEFGGVTSIEFISNQGISASITITSLFPSGEALMASYSVDDSGGGLQAPTTAPTALAPTNNAQNVPVDPLIGWGAVASADTYDLQVATDPSFTKTGEVASLVVNETGLVLSDYAVTGLNYNTTYYWRARGVNGGGAGPWTATQAFTTVNNVAVERLASGVPTDFHLYTNYPNPFNPTTTIRFDLPIATAVRLSIFDTLGREVDLLVAEQLQSGVYEYAWDAGDRPSGVFLYRLEAGMYSQTGSMILLK